MRHDAVFENQFDQRTVIASPFGEIETVDITPLQSKTRIPVLFAPGWRETPELQKECLYAVFQAQRRVVTLHHARRAYAIRNTGNYPVVEVQKAKTLLHVLEEKGIARTDVITHSEGAINVAIAAAMQPEKFRHIVLVTPAGLLGKDSLIRLSFGFVRHMTEQIHHSFFMVKEYMQKRPARKNPNLFASTAHAVREGRAMVSFDIHPLLIDLRKKGIRVAVLAGEKDTALPFEKMKQHLAKTAPPPDYGFNIFATKPGGHELYSKPTEIMPQVERLLQKLESGKS